LCPYGNLKMIFMKKTIVFFALLCAVACAQGDKEKEAAAPGAPGAMPSAKDTNVAIINEEGKDSINTLPQKTAFTEGVITTSITFPGNPLNEEMKKMGNNFDVNKIRAMILETMKDTTDKDKGNAIERIMTIASMSVLPLKSQVFVTADKVLYKGESMAYKYDNLYQPADKTGKMIIYSRRDDDKIGITYAANSGSMIVNRPELSETAGYTVTPSKEERTIGGFLCKKIVYTKKENAKGAEGMNMSPQRVELWYTTELPATLNLDQAFKINIEGAILRSEITMGKNAKMKMVYQVTAIQARMLTAKEMKLPEVEENYDADKDGKAASMAFARMMGVATMFQGKQ
jgi:hypothetical protein